MGKDPENKPTEEEEKNGNGTDSGKEPEKDSKKPHIYDTDVKIDGEYYVPKDVHEKYKEDFLTVKAKMHKLEKEHQALVDKANDEKKIAEENQMKENNQYKELVEHKDKEIADLKTKFKKSIIRNEVSLESAKQNAKDVDDILRFIDFDDLPFNEDTGKINGIDTIIGDLKNDKPYLFGTEKPGQPQHKVDDGKPIMIAPDEKYEDLLKDPGRLKKIKADQPDIFKKLRGDYLKNQ